MTVEEVVELKVWTEIKPGVLEVRDSVCGEFGKEEPHIMFVRVYHGRWLN